MILAGGFTAQDWIAIISAISAATVAIITAIGGVFVAARTGRKVDVGTAIGRDVQNKVTTSTGAGVAEQVEKNGAKP